VDSTLADIADGVSESSVQTEPQADDAETSDVMSDEASSSIVTGADYGSNGDSMWGEELTYIEEGSVANEYPTTEKFRRSGLTVRVCGVL